MKNIFIAALILFMPTPAMADYSLTVCRSFFDSATAPAEISALIDAVPGGGVERCIHPHLSGRTIYQTISPVVMGELGTCHYARRLIFLEPGENGESRWTYEPPSDHLAERTNFMALPQQGCPRQDDPRYVMTSDISEGLFLNLMNSWADLLARDSQNASLDRVPQEVRRSDDFAQFEAAIRKGPTLTSQIRIGRIRLDYSGPDTLIPHYVLGVSAGGSWSLLVDVTNEGMIILGISDIQ